MSFPHLPASVGNHFPSLFSQHRQSIWWLVFFCKTTLSLTTEVPTELLPPVRRGCKSTRTYRQALVMRLFRPPGLEHPCIAIETCSRPAHSLPISFSACHSHTDASRPPSQPMKATSAISVPVFSIWVVQEKTWPQCFLELVRGVCFDRGVYCLFPFPRPR